MKISEAFAKYQKNEVIAMNYSMNTYGAYKNTEKAAIKYFGDINIKRIDLDGVHNFYLHLTEIVSKNTARKYIVNLRIVLKFCKSIGIKVIEPGAIRTPREEKKVARFINENEYRAFLNAAGQSGHGYSNKNRIRNVLIIKMLYETGLRVGELCALNRDSIYDRRFVVVGKSKDPRPCFITKEMQALLDEYLSTRQDSNPALFIANQNGGRMTTHNVQRVFRNISKKANVGVVTPHTLRHSYATKMLDKGADIRVVAALLGHQNISTTQTYVHVTDNLLKGVYETIMDNDRASYPQLFVQSYA